MERPAAPYIGNGHYCYANATAMLLASVGERLAPDLIEVLTGVGLGALWLTEQELFFFGFVAPDRGISRALALLGFEVAEHAGRDGDAPPFRELAEALAAGPAVLGPLDMGHLTYAPGRGSATGMDHYVLAYALDATELHLHDPAGFPYVSLPVADLVRAWRAEQVNYRRGPFRWWSAPRRLQHPSERELVAGALRTFERNYAEADSAAAPGVVTGSLAIRQLAERIAGGELLPHFAGYLVRFVFQLAARRALDYAAFFEDCWPALAEAKREQAMLFGRCHTLAVRRD
ncbi:MAG: hypothetical protein JOY61_11505 [Chloroflexi bacterium]|nr:hypothetical protein [Chloroflexota bacterium]